MHFLFDWVLTTLDDIEFHVFAAVMIPTSGENALWNFGSLMTEALGSLCALAVGLGLAGASLVRRADTRLNKSLDMVTNQN